MDMSTCTALVTGANRGLGRHSTTELLKRGAKVYAGARNPDSVHVGLMNTDMAAGMDAPKSDPADVAAQAVDAIAAGACEILADDASRGVQAGLSKGVAGVYPQFA